MDALLRDRPFTARVDARKADRTSPAYKCLYWWGSFNCLMLVAQQYLNFIFNPLGAQKMVYISMLGWLLIALLSRRIQLRVPVAIAFIMLLQIWFGICTVHSQAVLGMHVPFNGMDLLLAVYALIFVQSSALVWFAPEARRNVGRVIIFLAVLSPFFALAQFLGFGPAQAVASLIRSADIVFNIGGGEEVIRAPGLHSNIGNAVVYSCAGAVAIACVCVYRRMRFYEFASIGMLFLGAMLVQVRNQLLVVLIAAIWILVLLFKQERARAIGYIGGGVAALAAFLLTKKDAFGYFFQSGTGTLDFRRDYLWPQAYNVLKYEPVFGIGIEPAFAGWSTQIFPNKWLTHSVLDNGFLLAGIFGGYPGMMIMIIVCVAAFIGTLRLFKAPHEDGWHLAFKAMLMMIVLFFGTGMYWGTLWANPITAAAFFVIAGLAMPSIQSEYVMFEEFASVREAIPGSR